MCLICLLNISLEAEKTGSLSHNSSFIFSVQMWEWYRPYHLTLSKDSHLLKETEHVQQL